jgi:hypothetical protein
LLNNWWWSIVDLRTFSSGGGTSNPSTGGDGAANFSDLEVEIQEQVEEDDEFDLDEYEPIDVHCHSDSL